jgi:hypothetical protein
MASHSCSGRFTLASASTRIAASGQDAAQAKQAVHSFLRNGLQRRPRIKLRPREWPHELQLQPTAEQRRRRLVARASRRRRRRADAHSTTTRLLDGAASDESHGMPLSVPSEFDLFPEFAAFFARSERIYSDTRPKNKHTTHTRLTTHTRGGRGRRTAPYS